MASILCMEEVTTKFACDEMPHLINACSYKMMSFLNKLGKVQHIGSPGKVLCHLLKKTKTIIYQFVGSVNFVSWSSSDIKNNYFLGKGSKTDLITVVPPSPKWGGCQSFDWCLVLVLKLFVNSFCPRIAMYGLIFEQTQSGEIGSSSSLPTHYNQICSWGILTSPLNSDCRTL